MSKDKILLYSAIFLSCVMFAWMLAIMIEPNIVEAQVTEGIKYYVTIEDGVASNDHLLRP
jgi:hypothetical protein